MTIPQYLFSTPDEWGPVVPGGWEAGRYLLSAGAVRRFLRESNRVWPTKGHILQAESCRYIGSYKGRMAYRYSPTINGSMGWVVIVRRVRAGRYLVTETTHSSTLGPEWLPPGWQFAVWSHKNCWRGQYVTQSGWYSPDGEIWMENGQPVVSPEFNQAKLRLLGGPRDGKEVAG